MNQTQKYMLDTNAFDRLLERDLPASLPIEIYVTHVQRDEIQNIVDIHKLERKNKLLAILSNFNETDTTADPSVSQPSITRYEKIATESAIWETSNWDESNWSSKNNYISEISGDNPKHHRDALIGETALKNNLILVTNDKKLQKKINGLGGQAISFDQFVLKIGLNNN